MAANTGSYGVEAFGGESPASGPWAWPLRGQCPPTFATVSGDDPIASPRVMERRRDALKQSGIVAEFRRCRYAGHGFGTGEGKDAESWMEQAVRFGEEQS